MNLSSEPLSAHVSDIRGAPMLFTADGTGAADSFVTAMETVIMSAGDALTVLAIYIGFILIVGLIGFLMMGSVK